MDIFIVIISTVGIWLAGFGVGYTYLKVRKSRLLREFAQRKFDTPEAIYNGLLDTFIKI